MTAQAGSTTPPSTQRAQARTSTLLEAERAQLRREIRRKRRALSTAERAEAERAIGRHIRALGAYRHARRMAMYFSFDGEPDLARLMSAAARAGKTLYAPVLAGESLHFRSMHARGALVPNRFGILEPRRGKRIDARALDLVLTPLVGFDVRGARLGVGRGYYDRTFAFLRNRGGWAKPKLLGVAFEVQRVEHLETRPWDVPLWGAVTEAGVYRFPVTTGPL